MQTKDELFKARAAAHAAFDPLWRRKMAHGLTKKRARGEGYKWLARQMGMAQRECHIAAMSIEQARRVAEICARHLDSTSFVNALDAALRPNPSTNTEVRK